MKHRTNFLRTIGALLLLALTLTLLCACTESRNVTGASLNDKGELILSYSDGTSDNLGIVKGRDGKDGAQGIPGLDGKTGKDGVDGEKGDPGADGKDGADGSEGVVTVVPDSNSVTLAAAKGLRSAVSIYCTFAGGTSAGSGVIWKLDSAGNALIITNHHVVYDADTSTNGGICEDIELYLYGSEYSQFAIDATYLGGSMYYDIAVLSVTESDFLKSSNAVAATVTDSDAIRVGDQAIAVGNPKGIGLSASFGVVSVESEEITMRVGGEQEEVDMRVMRVDTAVNAGNSGGGLYNAAGELCGIVNAKLVSDDVENMGYAIPSNLAVAVAQNIVDHCDGESSRCVKRAMIGIEIRLLDSRTETKPDGRLQIVQTVGVSKINDTSAAKDILAVGDQILSITFGEKTVNVTRMHHLTDRMLDARVGDTVTLTIVRDGAEMQKQIAITETELVEY